MSTVRCYVAALRTLNNMQSPLKRRIRRSGSARERTDTWIRILGIREKLRGIKFIHVAGTKGKGTTCLYCEHILSQYKKHSGASIKVGCLTSPHLSDVRERIRLNSSMITQATFGRYFWELYDVVNKEQFDKPSIPGYPGFMSLLGLYIFAEEGVNIAVVETGIGGEYDSTNVIETPSVTGITAIGLDHLEVLGNSIQNVAWHKAGIFKSGSPAFTVQQKPEVLEVLRERSRERNVSGQLITVSEDLIRDYGVQVTPDLPYQRRNASLAIALCNQLLRDQDPSFSMSPVLARSIEQTALPGRNEMIVDNGRVWLLDSAHNEMSMIEATKWVKTALATHELRYLPRVLLFSHESMRDSNRLLEILCKALGETDGFETAILCTNRSGVEEKLDLEDQRAHPLSARLTLERHATTWLQLTGKSATVMSTIYESTCFIQRNYPRAAIVVAGNLYLAGTVRFLLRGLD